MVTSAKQWLHVLGIDRQICFLYNEADGNGRMAPQLQQEHIPDW
jgi:hypothetical protein